MAVTAEHPSPSFPWSLGCFDFSLGSCVVPTWQMTISLPTSRAWQHHGSVTTAPVYRVSTTMVLDIASVLWRLVVLSCIVLVP